MKFCSNCGAQIADNAKFCSECGHAVELKQETVTAENKTQDYQKKVESAVADFVNTNDETSGYDESDINDNKILALLSYLGILFIVPLIAAPQSKFAKFHANQGLVLFIACVVVGLAGSVLQAIAVVLGFLFLALVNILFTAVGLVLLALIIIGIVNACQGKAKELPLIGHFRFIK